MLTTRKRFLDDLTVENFMEALFLGDEEQIGKRSELGLGSLRRSRRHGRNVAPLRARGKGGSSLVPIRREFNRCITGAIGKPARRHIQRDCELLDRIYQRHVDRSLVVADGRDAYVRPSRQLSQRDPTQFPRLREPDRKPRMQLNAYL